MEKDKDAEFQGTVTFNQDLQVIKQLDVKTVERDPSSLDMTRLQPILPKSLNPPSAADASGEHGHANSSTEILSKIEKIPNNRLAVFEYFESVEHLALDFPFATNFAMTIGFSALSHRNTPSTLGMLTVVRSTSKKFIVI